jgi:hypothetical protein
MREEVILMYFLIGLAVGYFVGQAIGYAIGYDSKRKSGVPKARYPIPPPPPRL